MADPTVSVIVPCYNNQTTIGETLESLLKQTFSDWEAIVVNDGSSDASAGLIYQYCTSDSRIKQIDQQNQGLSGARNSGLAAAKGEFVNFLDADDLLLPDMLKRTVQNLKKDTSLGAVTCGWIFSDPEIQDLSWTNFASNEGQLFEKLAHGNLFPCHSVLLRREILHNVGVFDFCLSSCEDWDLWLRIARVGIRFGCISEPMVIYRMSPVSLSRNALTFFEAGEEVIRRGHEPDPRVEKPAPEFARGCQCSMIESVNMKWLLHCVGLTISQGDDVQASKLLETTISKKGIQINPNSMKAMMIAFWFGTATPKGNWDVLLQRIGRPLLQFLLRQEERLEVPGFAIQSILEMTRWRELQGHSGADSIPGRQLLGALKKKVILRLSQYLPWKSRPTRV